jgi:hypothetical protein
MMGSDLIDTDIGPDTVTLVFRTPAAGLDTFGRPNVTERTVDKTGCDFQFDKRPTEDTDESGSVASIRRPTCRLPIDDDTSALDTIDAIRFGGRTYEMQGPAIIRESFDGPDHVYTDLGYRYDTGLGERVTVTPNGGRDDDGNVLAGGAPFDAIAFDVQPGNTVAKFGPSGEVSEAAFTITLPINTAIHDDDWVTVRGKTGRARIQMQLPQYAGRERLVVLVDTKSGGAS